ncbi:MAG: hydrolase [Patescibacteria group bacterium]
MTNQKEECCPSFQSEKWDEKTQKWDNKIFIQESIPTLFHIPFPPMIGKKITSMQKMAEATGSMPLNTEDTLILFEDPSPFKSNIYLSVTKQVPGAKNISLSGVFISKVFDGAYNAVPKFIKEMDTYLSEQNKTAKRYFIHYAYCPQCAKDKKRNYMILFAEI